MSKLNRFRWISCAAGGVFCVLFFLGEIGSFSVLEAVSVVGLFVDLLLIGIKTRCPCCNRTLRLHPPVLGEEFCPHCGCKIE